eukprot:CAMPEP_0113938356 /NCGR_PEP_ID=MMETSP1339-20121228/4804_1 /TAXON_ID=94617 /ORGANISM="Fibrocapsa japonica" /LENGTH=159 /DNA_ID=CAMNT_0000941445 /DNA_START=47 /DNA_END=526 /DNA_ORIENTATION=+ /assembly_acc=CAM_ASM_000762
MAQVDAETTQTEPVEYDVTDCCTQLWCCCMASNKLFLSQEEVRFLQKTPCGTNDSKRPYGELGSVDKTNCLCCHGLNAGFSAEPIFPKFCGIGEEEFVNTIVQDLKSRMRARGDTGQIKRAEQQIQMLEDLSSRVGNLESKIDAIIKHMGVNEVQTMER